MFDFLRESEFRNTKKGAESVLDTVPETVNQAYEKILAKSKKDSQVRKVLSIILAAARPLTLAEMNVALNFTEPIKSFEDLDLEPLENFKKRLRSLCGLFVSVYGGKVYFLHQTAREFLLADPSSDTTTAPTIAASELRWHHSITTQQAETVLARICVAYLDLLNSRNVLAYLDQLHAPGR